MTKPDDLSRALRYAAPPPVHADGDEFDALAVVRLLRRRIWLIAGVALVIVLLALPAILGVQPLYFASSRLLIQNPLATTLTSSSEDRLVKLNLTTEVERLMSRDTATRVVESLGIDSLPEFNPALREPSKIAGIRGFIRGLVTTDAASPVPAAEPNPLDMVIPEFLGSLSVARDPTSDVVEIGFSSSNPELAAAVPTAMIHIYLDERQSHLADEVGQATGWIQQRIDEQTARVAAATKAADDFSRSSGLAAKDPPGDGAAQGSAAINAQRAEVARTRADLETTLAGIKGASTLADRIVLTDSPTITALSRDVSDQQYALDRLLRTYGNMSEEVIDARARLEATSAQLTTEVDRYTQSLQAKIDALDREDVRLVADLEGTRAILLHQQELEVRRQELVRRIDAEQEALGRLEEQRRTLTAEGKLPVANIEMLSQATVPPYASSRSRSFYLLATLVLASMVGVTAACIVEMLDRSVRSHEQLRRIAGISPAQLLPLLPRRMARLPDLRSQRPGGMFGTALRGIVLALEQASDGKLPGSVLVTSPLPGDGKSLVSACLALELAASGNKVLLVDGDLMRGRLHTLFGVADNPGLAEVLAGEMTLGEVVTFDSATGIAFVPRGRSASPPLDRETMTTLIGKAKAEGRILVMDSVPALASPDAAVAAGEVQRTLLLARWGRTGRAALETTVERLLAARPDRDILVAINMVDPRRHALYGFRDAALFARALQRYQYTNF